MFPLILSFVIFFLVIELIVVFYYISKLPPIALFFRKRFLWNSVKNKIKDNISVSGDLLSNPFINNSITMDVVSGFIHRLCSNIGKGPIKEIGKYSEEKPYWTVGGTVYLKKLERQDFGRMLQKIYTSIREDDDGLLRVFGSGLKGLSEDEMRLFFKAIEVHIKDVVKFLKFPKNEIYKLIEISINSSDFDNGDYWVGVSIKFKNPKYTPADPITPKQWF